MMNKKHSSLIDGSVLANATIGNLGIDTPFAISPQAQATNPNAAPAFVTGGDGIMSTDFSGQQDFGQSAVVQTDGKILVAGYSGSSTGTDFALVRYNSDGSLDTSFDGDGKASTPIGKSFDFGYAVTVQKDGKILLAGMAYNGSNYDFALVRYQSNGALDTGFSGDGKVTANVGLNDFGFSMAMQSDGKILVSGFTNHNGHESFALARYTSIGELDTSFDGDGKAVTDFGNNGAGHAVAVQKDGKILVAGDSDHHFALIRYNSNGSLDTSFSGDGKVSTAVSASNDYGTALAVQSDGKILVAGYSKNTANNFDFAVVRYNSNGTLDSSFDNDGKATTALGSADDKGQAITLQSDGKILVSGFSYNGSSNDFAIVRYNSNGGLDTNFSGDGKLVTALGADNDQAYSVSIQADGKILVSGSTDNGSNSDFALVRYNADGSLDKTFAASNTLGGTVAYTENGTAVVLDGNAQIYDYELASQGHYNGASITLARQGGANAQDLFSGKGTLVFNGNSVLLVDAVGLSTTVGSASNSNGTLKITFNSNATQARVNTVLSALAYSNSSDTPPSSVQIDWTFSDGNSGAQGTGGAFSAIGSTVVSITPSNDKPTGTVTITGVATQGEKLTASNTLADADGLGAITYTWKTGTTTLATGSSYTLTANEVGKAITVTASYQDSQGTAESVASAATDLVGQVDTGSQNNDVLTGTNGNDTLTGGGGNDTLNGGAGRDRLVGNTGDDIYYIDNIGDTVVELVNEGKDTVFTNINWNATGYVENIVLLNNAHVVTGNNLDNKIKGGTGNDTLDGSLGNDILLGGGGNDVLISGSGNDTLVGGVGNDTYVLTGGAGYIEDFLGIDTLDASAATGNSSINLATGLCNVQGQTSHFSTPGTTFSPLDVQFLQDLSGSFYDDIGNVAQLAPAIVSALQAVQHDKDSKFGVSTFVDKPLAPFGNADEWVYKTLLPLATSATTLGNTYNAMVVKYGADEPEAQIEALMQLALHSSEVGFRADSARFVVLFSDATYHKAGDGAQAGITTANNGDAAISNSEDYPLIPQVQAALAAANIIPIFAIANGYETVYQSLVAQLQRGAVVSLNDDSSNIVDAINAGLKAGTVTNIENALGGAGNDTLIGSAIANTLSGGGGNDILNGGLGNDILTGGAGNDVFLFNAALGGNIDKITDFVPVDDTIQLENAIFTQLTTPGVLDAGQFKQATAAADANDFLVYNSGTGALSYDADGNGTGAAVQIATLGVGLALTAADFVVV